MTEDKEFKEYSKLINSAFERIFKLITNRSDPTTHRYTITYNKKLDVIEVLKIVSIDGKNVLLEPPLWPHMDDHNGVTYSHAISQNWNYPTISKQDRIILDTVEYPKSQDTISKHIAKITKFKGNS